MSSEPEDEGPPGAPASGGTPRPQLTPRVPASQAEEPWRAYLDLTRTVGSARTPEDHKRSFEPGQLLSGRFRIVRFVASGGMGEVYEAEDLVLRERVALKTIRSDAGDERDAERFRREIQLARKVTHPNVCRIYDVFHHVEEGSERSVAFLTMELLEGETLAQHLAGRGRLTPAEALPLLRQMAAALDAAHARGVTHRDFKPGNVMLVPGPGGPARVAVTDFGLALAHGPSGSEEGSASISLVGRIVGTPAYMAPEQVKAARVGPAADVYAFGVVAYEMVAGRPPFVGENSLSTATLRLEGPAPPPTRFAPGLDGRWERAILRCLEREPARRFERAGDFCREIERPGRGERWRRRLPYVGLATLVLAGAWFLGRTRPPSPGVGPSAAIPQRRAVAVLGFRNLAARPEQAWLSTALSEMLSSELTGGGRLRVVPGESVARAQADLALGGTESLAADSLQRLRGALAVDVVVLGSYFAPGTDSGGRVRLDLRVQDALTGETVHSLIENGTEAELPALVSRCGQQLRGALGAGSATSAEGTLQAAFGQDPRATRLYSEGLALLRQHEAGAARDKLLEATVADPRHALAQSALADAWARLGYQERARAAAQKALDLAGGLPREQRLQVEARRHEHSFDWPAAARTYRTLFDFFPDSVEYGLELAESLSRGGQGQEALEVVSALRRLPPPEGQDARIDLAEARAARSLSDLARSGRAARDAARKAETAGARLVAADALLEQSWASFLQGQGPEAKRSAGRAQALFEQAGDRNGAADAAQLTAHMLWMQEGSFAGAVALYEQALAAYRASGNRRGVAQALVNLAGPRAEQGELSEARRLCEEALPLFVETSAAEEQAAVLVNLSSLLSQSGDLPGARRRAEEALSLSRRTGSRSAEAHALESAGQVLLLEGRLEAARGPLLQAHETRKATGERISAAAAELLLAEVDLEAGQPARAAQVASRVAEEMQAAQRPDEEVAARALQARAALVSGRPEDARAVIAPAEKLAAGLGRVAGAKLEVVAAQVAAASGQRAAGLERLRKVREAARRSGQVDVELRAWRALVTLAAEDPDGLAREARRRGYLLYGSPPARP